MFKSLVITGAVAFAFISSPALAAEYLFTLTGATTASFFLPASPIPDHVINGRYFKISNVDGVFASGRGSAILTDLYFFKFTDGGGFRINDPAGRKLLASTFGSQLFSGSPHNPTFVLGSYELHDDTPNSTIIDHLVISDLTAAVPEPATWTLMITGFGAIGAAMRRRKVANRFA